MSKVVIAGEAVVVTSAMKLEELETIKKYRPNALVLMGGEDGKEPVFAIDVTSGAGSINTYGASFNAVSHDDQKLATITMVANGVKGDVREWVADQIGGAIINLNKLEETLPGVLAEIQAEKDTVMANISIAGVESAASTEE